MKILLFYFDIVLTDCVRRFLAPDPFTARVWIVIERRILEAGCPPEFSIWTPALTFGS